MKIKLLLNDIKNVLIECFEELTAYDIYCSYDPKNAYFQYLRLMS